MTYDPNAAIWAAEARSRERALNERLDALGIPHNPEAAAAWYEREAGRARAEAGRQVVAEITELARQVELDERQDHIDQELRERERLVQLRETLDQAARDVAEACRRQEADERRQETALVDEQLGAFRARAAEVRLRKSFGLQISVGERKLLDTFDAET